jgi:hypothetical protein
MQTKTAITSRRLCEFFPDTLLEEFVKRDKPPEESVTNKLVLMNCAIETLKRPDKGIGRKRPRKCRSRIGVTERKERVRQSQELGRIAHDVLTPPSWYMLQGL